MSKQPTLYRFWVQTKGGEVVEWTHLSERQAKLMHGQAERNLNWAGADSFGWGAMP